MRPAVACFLPDLSMLLPPDAGQLHGAFLASQRCFRWIANDPAFEKLEVFLPPGFLNQPDILRRAAEHVLIPASRGKGRLSFYAFHHLPEVFGDGHPRVLRSIDPAYIARDRAIRDRFAIGPTVLSVDTHLTGNNDAWLPLRMVLEAPPAPFDGIQLLSPRHLQAMQTTLHEMVGVESTMRFDVIPRSVDCEQFRPPTLEERRAARKRADLPPDVTVAMYHSRVGPYGKADLGPLIRAFAACSREDDWLGISGGESAPNAYAALKVAAAEAGVESRVKILGPVQPEDVPARLAAADFFVLPGDFCGEAGGNAVIEALACGLPCLVSDWDGLTAAVRNGENGFVTPTYVLPGLDRISAFSTLNPFAPEYLLASQCIVCDEAVLTRQLDALLHDASTRSEMTLAARTSALAYDSAVLQGCLRRVWEEQLQEAAVESVDAAQARRAFASRLGCPTPYGTLLAEQGTRTLTEDDRVSLTQRGRDLLAAGRPFRLAEEIGVVVPADALSAILRTVAENSASCLDCVKGPGSALQTSDRWFALGVLIKLGVVRIDDQS